MFGPSVSAWRVSAGRLRVGCERRAQVALELVIGVDQRVGFRRVDP
jgi:hypothetical protein